MFHSWNNNNNNECHHTTTKTFEFENVSVISFECEFGWVQEPSRRLMHISGNVYDEMNWED